ncbi:Chitin synthase 1 [Cyphellophora attinorum]|uniref:Chitin synthase n=1 Tax=Cyphellophora attinorum TaxID=1664694 RepID=A0A0N0NK91_9EURO|nr:Chitin synthase 1 [Phialophora attinorum]KPI37768.1 Chitin synthase 1 [Phialophora attinorum]
MRSERLRSVPDTKTNKLAISIPDSHHTVQATSQSAGIELRRRPWSATDSSHGTGLPKPTPTTKHFDINQDTEPASLYYTPATCPPDEFVLENGYTLQTASPHQPLELLIGVTYYNESRSFLAKSLQGVLDNVRHAARHTSIDGCDAADAVSRRTVICLLLDGYEHCDSEVLELLTSIGIFQEELMRSQVDGVATTAHIFERTCWLSSSELSSDRIIEVENDEIRTPMQILLCLKEKNAKKINSHRWLFNAFGRILNPNVCILLDAGTRPQPSALTGIWKAFQDDPNLGGACGELCVDVGPRWKNLLNPLVAVQNFEYKMSHIMDKSLESCVGYVSVLPGAFSAYRYEALRGEPLRRYFQGDHSCQSSSELARYSTVFHKNMFLAEDRVLGFEILAKAGAKWHLGYVWGCRADTDAPPDIVELLVAGTASAHASTIATINNYLLGFYVWFLVFQIILALGSRPRDLRYLNLLSALVFCMFSAYILSLSIYSLQALAQSYANAQPYPGSTALFSKSNLTSSILVLAVIFGGPIICSLAHLSAWHILTSWLQYILFAPCFVNLLMLHAFCNWHDVSWGTKGSDVAQQVTITPALERASGRSWTVPGEEFKERPTPLRRLLTRLSSRQSSLNAGLQEQSEAYRKLRTYLLLAWLLSNFAIAVCIGSWDIEVRTRNEKLP